MKTVLYKWIKENSTLLFNAASLIATTGITMALGFVYWWVAAREFAPAAVGLGAATISAMTLIGTICLLGFGTLLVGELPRHKGNEGPLISASLLLVGGVSGFFGILFALMAPFVSPDFQVLRANIFDVLLFALGVSFTAVTLLLDQAVIGLLRGGIQLWRNALFALVKLVALFIAGIWLTRTGMTIYNTWSIGNGVSLIALAIYTIGKGYRSVRNYLPQWKLLHNLRTAALQHHLLNLTLQAPTLAFPVLVTIVLSATANGWFYVSWTLASLGTIIPYVLTVVLYAMTSTNTESLTQKTRMTVSIATIACFLVACVLLFGTKQVLMLFGPTYAEQATWCLRILALGAFPRIIKDHYIVICRLQNRTSSAIIPMMFGGILELALGALGAYKGGLAGLSVGLLIALCIEAAYGFRTVYKVIWPIHRHEESSEIQDFSLADNTTQKVEAVTNVTSIGR